MPSRNPTRCSLSTTERVSNYEGFAGAADQGVAGVTEGAKRAEAALRRVVSWASWRLLGWIMVLITALVLLGWLSSTALVWWDSGRIEKLQDQIATLQANHDAWVKAGMLDRLERCNPGNRPCVEVDENAGTFGTQGDYRVIQGY